jgi:hypothetical protein
MLLNESLKEQGFESGSCVVRRFDLSLQNKLFQSICSSVHFHGSKTMPVYGAVPSDNMGDDEDADSCVCGLEHLDEEATSDEELPPASGGIAQTAEEAVLEDEDDVDGCALDFAAAEQTDDEELPATVGGV